MSSPVLSGGGRTPATIAGVLTAFACCLSPARALITDVVETNLGGDTPAVIELGAFAEDALTFSDRTHEHNGAAFDAGSGLLSTTGTVVVPLPEYLLGGDYVRFANDARENVGYQAVVTTDGPADFYLLIDNRANSVAGNTSSPNTTDPILDGTLSWVVDDGWQRVITGISPGAQADYTGVDESGNGTGPGEGLNQFYSVYRLSNIMEVTLQNQAIPSSNMYALVVVPAADVNVPIRNYFPIPGTILEGETAILRWLIAPDATSATIDNGVGDILGDTDASGAGEVLVFPVVDTDYTLTVVAPSGTEMRTVSVDTFVIRSFTTTGPRISFGGTSTLQWEISPNFTEVVIADGMGNDTDVTAFTDGAGIGSFSFNPEVNTTYTLTVTTPNQSEEATVDVQVRFIERFTASPAFFEPGGGTTTLGWQVRPDVSLSLSGVGAVTADAFGSGSVVAEVTGTQTFVLTAEADGEMESQQLTVRTRPTGTPFALLDIGATGGTVEPGAADGAQIGAAPHNTNGQNLDPISVLANTGANFTVAIDNISATGAVVGGLDWRDRGTSFVPSGALAEDLVKNNSGVVRVTLGGLPDSSYAVLAYFIDPDFSQSSTINIIVTDADRLAEDTGVLGDSSFPVGDIIPGVGGMAESDISSRTRLFSIRSNGFDDVVIVFDGRGGSDNETPLNALYLIDTEGVAAPPQVVSVGYDVPTQIAAIRFTSSPGETYRIEASEDLRSWEVLEGSYPAAVAGAQTDFTEAKAGDPFLRRFYRITRN